MVAFEGLFESKVEPCIGEGELVSTLHHWLDTFTKGTPLTSFVQYLRILAGFR